MENRSPAAHRKAVLQGLFVTFLWSTSWIFIKIGLKTIPPVTFAGLRYTLAFLILLPLSWRGSIRASFGRLTWGDWGRIALLGLLFIAITQGAQFLGLSYLPAVTTSLLLNFTTLLVAFLGIGWLGERPSIFQWTGILVFLSGVFVYFYPVHLISSQWLGILIVLGGVIANANASVLGRAINRVEYIHPFIVTLVSIGVGGSILLISGVATTGWPSLGLLEVGLIVWLALVNTSFTFILWNHTLRTLSAVESSILNGSMLVQIAILAWIFLDEALNWKTGMGLGLVVLGILFVQVRPGALKVKAGDKGFANDQT